MNGHFTISALDIVSPLLVAALTWVAARVSRLISTRIQNERMRAALLRLDEVVVAVVKEMFQTAVDALRESSPDGKLPPDAAEALKHSAIAAIKAQLGPIAFTELQRALGLSAEAAHDLISTRVEAAVYSLKRAAGANGTHGPLAVAAK
jgi:hypothetical protein